MRPILTPPPAVQAAIDNFANRFMLPEDARSARVLVGHVREQAATIKRKDVYIATEVRDLHRQLGVSEARIAALEEAGNELKTAADELNEANAARIAALEQNLSDRAAAMTEQSTTILEKNARIAALEQPIEVSYGDKSVKVRPDKAAAHFAMLLEDKARLEQERDEVVAKLEGKS